MQEFSPGLDLKKLFFGRSLDTMSNQTSFHSIDALHAYLNNEPICVDGLSVQTLAKYAIMKYRAEAIETSLKANSAFFKWRKGQSEVNQNIAAKLLKKTMQSAEVVMRSPALESEKDDIRFARAVESHNEALENFYSKLVELSASSSGSTDKPV